MVKSWISGRSEPTNVSRDFWMPDESCRVCYECDTQFTLFNRRHHCRLCGRVFCGKCTENSIPVPSGYPTTSLEEQERIRVCNYCYKQWEQGMVTLDNGIQRPNLGLSTSQSGLSLGSTRSSETGNSSINTLGSMPYSFGPYQQAQHCSGLSSLPTSLVQTNTDGISNVEQGRSSELCDDLGDLPSDQQRISMIRSEDEDYEYDIYRMDSEAMHYPSVNDYYNQVGFEAMNNDDGLHKVHPDSENIDSMSLSCSPLENQNFEPQDLENILQLEKKEDELDMGDEGEASSSLYVAGGDVDAEPVDFENNGLLWLPPEPEDEEDEKETGLFDDDDDDDGDDGNATGEWGYLRSSSFGSGESRNRDRSNEEHKKAMKNVVDGHFRALVAQLLQVENLPIGEEDDRESWLEIITSLSWEAATLLKPDMSKGGGMDPGGYVKVKCIASGHRRESMVIKGVVCKKNVAHRRMTSKVKKARILILGGALEYQRVSNHLSSFDTLLQQEMDHLKMAVAKIDAHLPDVLLVEKSVSRFAQEYLLAKDISLVLNIKKPLLERIARCTGAQIVSSIDHLSSQKLGSCEAFHVERFLEDLGTAGQGGKKLVKTLMFFEGCPKPLGCTILLRGANGDELKKVKHVIQYGIFAAYHLALETSFLADEGATLPEFSLNSPITVTLPDKSTIMERSISTVPFSNVSVGAKSVAHHRSNSVPASDLSSYISTAQSMPPNLCSSIPIYCTSLTNSAISSSSALTGTAVADSNPKNLSPLYTFGEKTETYFIEPQVLEPSAVNNSLTLMHNHPTVSDVSSFDAFGQSKLSNDKNVVTDSQAGSLEIPSLEQDGRNHLEEPGLLKDDLEPIKEEFAASPSEHQSILVSLSSRCIWKGTVCERSHLLRIKYYGNCDKPLGRFLRDHLFDQSYQCQSCDMPSEAHVQCYTHRQGTLTISVKKLSEILLPGEKEGKIWMWHRCLRCPRINGFPPATRRIVMSDAAWGLSFGKFLELSFSNHAAASRVASCGHSLHRDCLRFYGFGKMVACFRYASINVLSVYLPPQKLDFNYENQEWIQKETDKAVDRAELLFSEVLNALSQIAEKRSGPGMLGGGVRIPESRRQTIEMEGILQKEKEEFEESLLKTLNKEVKKGHPPIDILEINRLRRQLLFQSFVWDNRLVYAASLDGNGLKDGLSRSISEHEGKIIASGEKIADMNVTVKSGKGYNSCDSFLVEEKCSKTLDYPVGFSSNADQPNLVHQELSNEREDKSNLSPSSNLRHQEPSNEREDKANSRRTLSEGEFSIKTNLSDTLDAAWIGEANTGVEIPKGIISALSDLAAAAAAADSSVTSAVPERANLDHAEDPDQPKLTYSFSPVSSMKGPENMEDSGGWLRMPFLNFYRSLNKNFFASAQKLNTMGEYTPVYVSSFRESELQGGARLLLPLGVNDVIIPVYDDEPSSIISYALASRQYQYQVSDEGERQKEIGEFMSSSLSDSMNYQSFHSSDDTASESYRSFGSAEEGILSGSRGLDPLSYTKALHARVSFGEDGPLGNVKYSVTCYYARRFDALRRICCPSELDYIRSLSRCKKWGAQGGKSNVFFAKTLDDRFIIKQVTKTELESFLKFAPHYFKYLSDAISTRSPTCLAKIVGIYQVTSKHVKGVGKESKMDVLVMENLLFRRNVTRLYDLKGSARSRYNADSSGRNKVLLDQNLIEAMPTSPIFVGTKAKRLLERAVWNDTSFLASVDVMDYSLLVGLDEEKHELVLGIIDFMRQYTWDKHLETWVKTTGILGGPKNESPTVISPKQYKKRFRKAMTAYFLMVPDQWFNASLVQSKSQSDLCEENSQGGI
ncbi:1-phosphatidylinositol-3-phosphate 5-kinase FAB1B isoform X2 [Humulus lupulus]|nr:1-phosphatidylinositol-3-phosphate 5-kinase FAB1B isoform X2 [Humulus lupulus]XP_062087943.1 1-phosphatidylinositol-3-phosphate 5-kinase FAB1B isoform X2 [Humulus lupulus]